MDPEVIDVNGVVNGSLPKNAIYDKYPDGREYATQRPNLSLTSVASSYSVPAKGRGIYYWNAVSSYVIVNNDTVYYGDYTLPWAQKITAGKLPVTILEIGQYLVILDCENNEGWYVHITAPTILAKITDPNFPPNQTPALQLSGGGCVLDGLLYVMSTDKYIWNSASYDPTTWNAIDFIRAEREEDVGVYLTKHHDHIVAFGARSIEFFYDAGNPVGSPLTRRDDVAYRIGPLDNWSVFSTDDKAYFLGSEKAGAVGLFELSQFIPRKVSNVSVDQFFSIERARFGLNFLLCGFTTGSHHLIFITSYLPTNSSVIEEYTVVYDASIGVFYEYQATIGGVTQFGVISVSSRNSAIEREPSMMFSSGDIGIFDFSFLKLDTTGNGAYFSTTDYISDQSDYLFTVGGNSTNNFEFIVKLPENDAGTVTNKFVERMSVVGTTTSSGQDSSPIYVSWSDDHYRTFSAERPLHTGLNRYLTRGGKFKRRAYQLRYTGSDFLRIEGIELDIRASQYA